MLLHAWLSENSAYPTSTKTFTLDKIFNAFLSPNIRKKKIYTDENSYWREGNFLNICYQGWLPTCPREQPFFAEIVRTLMQTRC